MPSETKTTYLISPGAMKRLLTEACQTTWKSSEKVPTSLDHEDRPNEDQPELDQYEHDKITCKPQTTSSLNDQGFIKHSLLMTKEGYLLSASEGIEAEKAAIIGGLASVVWRTQVFSLTQVEEEAKRNEKSNEDKKSEKGKDKSILGNLEYLIANYDGDVLVVVPCHVYLICMVGNGDVNQGLIRHAATDLAKTLANLMEKVTPDTFLE